MFTAELTTGEWLRLAGERTGHDFLAIATACSLIDDSGRTSYATFIKRDFEVPPYEHKRGRRTRRRLYIYCLAVGVNPADLGLTDADRGAIWPPDDKIRRMLARQLQLASRASTGFGSTTRSMPEAA
jgi:hypothetical protein